MPSRNRLTRWPLNVAIALLGFASISAYAAPSITVSSNSVAFSASSPPFTSIMVGLGSPERIVRVTSVGVDPLTLSHIEISGTNAADFRLAVLCTTAPGPVVLQPPTRHCDVQVTFFPTSAGSRMATLLIYSNDPRNPRLEIPLTGSAIASAPRIAVSPSSVDFGLQPLGLPSTPVQLSVLSTGTMPVHIASITSSNTEFSVTHGCALLGAVHAGLTPLQCFVDIQFTPSGNGSRVGNLELVSDDPAGPKDIALTGSVPVALLSASPVTINFGSVEVGTIGSLPRTIVVNNAGTASGSILSASVSGANPLDFSPVTGAPCTAQPGSTCSLTVPFTPRTSGIRSAEVLITTDAPSTPSGKVTVTGFGDFIVPTSPPPPAASDDHHFATTRNVGTCSGNGQPVDVNIPVARALFRNPSPPLPPPLTVQSFVPAAVAAGTLSSTATLELMVLGFGSPSQHEVIVNGTSVGTVNAQPGSWQRLTVATVPIGLVKFANQAVVSAPPGTPLGPTPANNAIRINPYVGGSGGCLVLAWARVSFLAISPVILVHGNNSDGQFFVREGFTSALDLAGIPNDASLDMLGAFPAGMAAPIASNATTLQAMIPRIARSFGVDSVHIVAHSKGGLDTRLWLATNASSNRAGTPGIPGFSVLSLTTLSTPHQGSALADLAQAIDAAGVGLYGFSLIDVRTLGLATGDAATPDLTTFAAAAFNPPLPSGVDYQMLGGDADLNGDGVIRSAPVDEYFEARREAPGSLGAIFSAPPVTIGSVTVSGASVADVIVSAVYSFLRNVRLVGVTQVPVFIPPIFIITVAVPVPLPTAGPALNDLLVTIGSATGARPPFVSPFSPTRFVGAAGVNHASVASPAIGGAVIPLLIITDTTRGDLR